MAETTATPESKAQTQTFGRKGFSPGEYTLDLSCVRDAPMKVNGQPSHLRSSLLQAEGLKDRGDARVHFGQVRYRGRRGQA